jgi:type IX secretion system PorP/SprF family membrane protein
MRKIVLIFSCLCTLLTLSPWVVRGQDPTLSQFYAAPLLISPAFAGVNQISKVNFNHRNQWPNLNANYQFSALTADISVASINSGFGFIATTDKQFSNFKTTTLGLQYAYHVTLAPESSVSFGLEGAFVSKGIDYSSLVFGDQIESLIKYDIFKPKTDDDILKQFKPNANYVDLSTGALFNLKNTWLGVSAHHINAPKKSLFIKDDDILQTKYSVQLGTKILFEDSYYEQNSVSERNREKSISPVMHYKHQGTFDQMDLGAYLTLSPLVIGAWYRGIPLKNNSSSSTRESIVALLGYRQDNFSIGYSYDMTISNLGLPSGGAHEISIAYLFDLDMSIKKPYLKIKRTLSCPKF